MGKDRLYFLTFIAILLVFVLGASLGINYSIKISVNLLLEQQIESSKKEVQKLIYFVNKLSNTTVNENSLKTDIQELLYTVEPSLTYTALIDKEDHLICHPKITHINENYTISRKLNAITKHTIYLNYAHGLLMTYEDSLFDKNGINTLEILYEKSIKNTNLKIVSIISLDNMLLHVTKLKRRLYSIFILMGALIITISFFTVRFIASFYEKQLESKNTNLENDIINITKLNLGVFTYQQKISSIITNNKKEDINTTTDNKEPHKSRLISYKGDEITPVFIDNISYIYTENSVTYIVDNKGKKSFSKASLDEVYKNLDTTLFFRANRQFIINIISIEKIIKFGNSQLKIVINNSDALILIKKNKVAEFKKWLNI